MEVRLIFQIQILYSQEIYKQNLLIFISLAKSIDAVPILLTQPLGNMSEQQKSLMIL